jgi:hypothetical protein
MFDTVGGIQLGLSLTTIPLYMGRGSGPGGTATILLGLPIRLNKFQNANVKCVVRRTWLSFKEESPR